ncbi:uncharacterized protein LAJ45_00257 [Morchella importuna]|uniref:uncharacterized protein n=1 Tax=Morchella importuna TaxID=1174673 RepID=UPI001E8D48A9|nr:uncharacterized protein LAJ45_00257 [Morchella importuna]KAH8155248.1 hypothetical protein LAJ45_00257 [Morchella importuna]
MFRPAAAARSLLLRHASSSSSSSTTRTALLLRRPATTPSSRLLSTSSAAPSKKRSTLKGTATRWALAAGIVYWYTTSAVFADEPKFEEERPAGPTEAETDREGESASPRAAADELEEEASQEGAFNPETGEINWDCPCLGGMAHGPCGEEFKAAFSCFVFSTEEPKGVDCVDRFKGMQACFQKHPEIYGSELDDDDDDDLDADTDADPTSPATTIPSTDPLAAKSSPTNTGRPDRSDSLSASSSPGSAASTGSVPAHTGTAPATSSSSAAATRAAATRAAATRAAATRAAAPPAEVTERKTTPSLAEPSSSVPETPVLQGAHRGDAKARSVSDPPTEREKAVAEEDAPRRK